MPLVPVDYDPFFGDAEAATGLAMAPVINDYVESGKNRLLGKDLLEWGARKEAMRNRLAGQPLAKQVLDPESVPVDYEPVFIEPPPKEGGTYNDKPYIPKK